MTLRVGSLKHLHVQVILQKPADQHNFGFLEQHRWQVRALLQKFASRQGRGRRALMRALTYERAADPRAAAAAVA